MNRSAVLSFLVLLSLLVSLGTGVSEALAPTATGTRVASALQPIRSLAGPAHHDVARMHADAGADLIFIPSSFTAPTGEAHWEVLVRARAIENQCFVAAPGQAGIGAGGIPTYGNSMIVDPWGRVLARAGGDGEQVISATLDFGEMAAVRERLPALHNRKLPALR